MKGKWKGDKRKMGESGDTNGDGKVDRESSVKVCGKTGRVQAEW